MDEAIKICLFALLLSGLFFALTAVVVRFLMPTRSRCKPKETKSNFLQSLARGTAKYNESSNILTVSTDMGELQYKGSCTVWRQIPGFERCSTPVEDILCSLWHRANHEASKHTRL